MNEHHLSPKSLNKLPISSRYQTSLINKLIPRDVGRFMTALLSIQIKLQENIVGKFDNEVRLKRLQWWAHELNSLKLFKSHLPETIELAKFIHKNSYLKESFCHWTDAWIRLLISNQNSWLNQAEFNHFIDDFNNSADLLFAECLLQMPLKHQLKEFVIAAGNAKTRVMFLRDFGEHVRNGHVFFPLNLLGEFDLTTQHLSEWRTEADARNWIEVSSFQAKFIDDLYIQATQWLNPLPINEQKKVWPLRAQLQLAMNILKEIKQNDFAVISQKIETSPGKSMLITLGSRFFS